MTSEGKLIVLDGTDGSGKSTQLDLLKTRLQQEGHKVFLIKYPRYESTTGKVIARYLAGEMGSMESISPEFISLLYSADRYESRDQLQIMLDQGFIVLADRYCQSNFAFQSSKFVNSRERKLFLDWQKKVDADMPVPDLVVFFDMPREAREALIHNSDRKAVDIHEKNQDYQSRVLELYRKMAKEEGWLHIYCAQKIKGEWALGWREQIAEQVWVAVCKKFKWKNQRT